MKSHIKDTTIDTSTQFSDELAELIETYVADRFTVMDDSVIEALYVDLPDIAYLKGMVKGLRRNLVRQAAIDVDIEDAYPKIKAGSMAAALEQAKLQMLNVEDQYPKVETIDNKSLTVEKVTEILGKDNPDKSPEQINAEAIEVVTAAKQQNDTPLSTPELMVLMSGMSFSKPRLHEKSHEDEWEDDSVQPAHLLEQDPTATHRVPTTREFLEPHLSRVTQNTPYRNPDWRRTGLTEKDLRPLMVTDEDMRPPVEAEAKFESQVNTNKAPQIDRDFRSNLARYGIAQATLADITSNARPGGMFSADTLKHSKNKDLLLVRSPVTRPRQHLQLLESTDPQYYQYMWMAFEEALSIILADTTLPDNQARRLDDELLIERFAVDTASAAQVLTAIGNRDLLHVENVNTCIRLLTDKFAGVKLYTGDKVMVDGVWAKTWTHTTLRTPKGRFVFGDEGENIVWQTPAN